MDSNLYIMKLIDKKDTTYKIEAQQLLDEKIEQGYTVEYKKEKHDYFTTYHIRWYEKIK